MKTLLIPTDFTEASLSAVEYAAGLFRNEQLNIILLHMFHMPDAITDLLMAGREEKRYTYVTEEFQAHCTALKRLPNIARLSIECVYGHTAPFFRNYLDAKKVDFVVYDGHYRATTVCKDSVDLASLIRKARVNTIQVQPAQLGAAYERMPLPHARPAAVLN